MIVPSASLLYGLCGAALIGLGLYGFVAHRRLIRRVLAFNVIGSGIFLLFGASAYRDPAAGGRSGAAGDDHHRHRRGARSHRAGARADRRPCAARARSGALPEDETDEDGSEDAP